MSGSRPAQMSAIATASALGEDVGERVEQGGRPMVGQRLVDRPDAPARLALADRRERLADGRRVVAVVVVDHDAAGLALALEPPADAGERREAGGDRRRREAERRAAAPATPSAFAALWRPAVAQPDRERPGSGSSPWISSVVPVGVGWR